MEVVLIAPVNKSKRLKTPSRRRGALSFTDLKYHRLFHVEERKRTKLLIKPAFACILVLDIHIYTDIIIHCITYVTYYYVYYILTIYKVRVMKKLYYVRWVVVSGFGALTPEI